MSALALHLPEERSLSRWMLAGLTIVLAHAAIVAAVALTPLVVFVAAPLMRNNSGFASFGDWRGVWPGYRYTVEHSVHVRNDVRGRDIGRALVESLFPLALGLGKHVMIGGIEGE